MIRELQITDINKVSNIGLSDEYIEGNLVLPAGRI